MDGFEIYEVLLIFNFNRFLKNKDATLIKMESFFIVFWILNNYFLSIFSFQP
jgi:hypothetical protein